MAPNAALPGQSRPSVRRASGSGVPAAVILLVGAAYGVFGQSDAHPSFQSVSIKRNTSDWGEPAQHTMGVGAHGAENASLMLLIQFAFASHDNPMNGHSLNLPSSQVVGGPAWINSEGYDTEAKAAAHTDPKQIWLMWQTLLADRFKLRLHREGRELPFYDLTVAKSGPKLPAAKPAGCVSFPPGTPPRPVPGKVDCGYVSGPFGGYQAGLLHIKGSKVHMGDLIRELTSVLDRPVLDKTGFIGEFDLDLSFTRDEALRGFPGSGGPGDPNLPNIFAALEEQLGLKLVPAKGPVEILVVDHAERPAAN